MKSTTLNQVFSIQFDLMIGISWASSQHAALKRKPCNIIIAITYIVVGRIDRCCYFSLQKHPLVASSRPPKTIFLFSFLLNELLTVDSHIKVCLFAVFWEVEKWYNATSLLTFEHIIKMHLFAIVHIVAGVNDGERTGIGETSHV